MKQPSFWSVVRLVAARELVQRGRDKSFLVSTGFTLLIILALVAVPKLLGAGDAQSYSVAFTGPQAAQVAAAAQVRTGTLDITVQVRDVDPAAVADQLADGELDAAVDETRIRVNEEVDPRLGAVLQEAHRQVLTARALQERGLDPAAVAAASAVEPLRVETLDPPDPAAESREAVAFFGTFLLYFQLIGYGFWVALGVVEEKASRVVEVLLATVSTRRLLAGKILGIGLLGLLQLLLIAAVGMAAAVALDAVSFDADVLPVVGLVLAWFVLGYAFYASFFAAAAARVTQQEDLQNVTSPATLVIVGSFFASFYVANNPEAVVSRVLSLLPPFSALVGPARVSRGDMPLWEIGLSVLLMLLATAGLVVVAARLYDGAILRMGGKVSLREAWRGGKAPAAAASTPAEPAPREVDRVRS